MWCLQKGHQARLAGRKGLIWIVFPTYKVGRTAWRKFFSITPQGWITGHDGTEQHPSSIRMGNITFEFMSAENPEKLVGEGLIALWVDECGQIYERVWTQSLRPTLMDFSAPALLTGSPLGRNWYHRMFQRGLDPLVTDTRSYSVGPNQGIPSYANPFIPRQEIDDIARDLPERTYRQEILAEFLQSEGAVFRGVRECIRPELSKKRTCVLGIDLARHANFTVIVGMDADGGVTHFERFREIDWPLQKARILTRWRDFEWPMIVIDATHGSVGDPVASELMNQGVGLEPFEFTGKTKVPLIEGLVIAIEQRLVTIPADPVLINELESFDMTTMPSGNTRFHAPEGGHDDTVMALALAWRGCCRYGDSGVTLGAPPKNPPPS